MNHFKKMVTKVKNDKFMSNNIRFRSDNSSENDTKYEVAIDFFPGCKDNKYTQDFLNNKTIKEKLGVNNSTNYTQCSDLNYVWGDSISFYKNDIKELSNKKNFSSWIFSGTEDIAVATLGTLRFINELHYPIKKKKKKWKVDSQVAGMEQSYEYNLRFLTVKGVGHMVPEDNPKVAKALLDKFIEYNRVEPSIQKEESKNEEFPSWAIALIVVFSALIIVLIVFIIIRIRKKQSSTEIEEGTKLLT